MHFPPRSADRVCRAHICFAQRRLGGREWMRPSTQTRAIRRRLSLSLSFFLPLIKVEPGGVRRRSVIEIITRLRAQLLMGTAELRQVGSEKSRVQVYSDSHISEDRTQQAGRWREESRCERWMKRCCWINRVLRRGRHLWWTWICNSFWPRIAGEAHVKASQGIPAA